MYVALLNTCGATFYHCDILYNRIFCVLSLYLLLCIFKKILNKIYLGFSNLDRNFSFSLYSCLSLDFNIKFILYTYCCLKYCTLKCIAFNKFLRNHSSYQLRRMKIKGKMKGSTACQQRLWRHNRQHRDCDSIL